MPIYLLTPRHLQAPDWKLSSYRKPVQIEAESEDDARRAAAKFYCTPPAPDREIARAEPWIQPTLARVKVVAQADPSVPLKRAAEKS